MNTLIVDTSMHICASMWVREADSDPCHRTSSENLPFAQAQTTVVRFGGGHDGGEGGIGRDCKDGDAGRGSRLAAIHQHSPTLTVCPHSRMPVCRRDRGGSYLGRSSVYIQNRGFIGLYLSSMFVLAMLTKQLRSALTACNGLFFRYNSHLGSPCTTMCPPPSRHSVSLPQCRRTDLGRTAC